MMRSWKIPQPTTAGLALVASLATMLALVDLLLKRHVTMVGWAVMGLCNAVLWIRLKRRQTKRREREGVRRDPSGHEHDLTREDHRD